jgi:hypothetical protein
MLVSPSARKAVAGCCFFLSSVWGSAGALKLIFGVRITFPLFPPIDLERVAPAPALAVCLAFCILGAWLERTSRGARYTRELATTDASAGLLHTGIEQSSAAARESLAASPTHSTPPAA